MITIAELKYINGQLRCWAVRYYWKRNDPGNGKLSWCPPWNSRIKPWFEDINKAHQFAEYQNKAIPSYRFEVEEYTETT